MPPRRYPPIRRLADRHGLLLIEDAARALHAGSTADLSPFSFYANKVAAGEGGLLVGRGALIHKARLGRHGIDSSAWQRHDKRKHRRIRSRRPQPETSCPTSSARQLSLPCYPWSTTDAAPAARAGWGS
ncbi:DegT/DnrJ/EryC1/StrS family aminotransferase [Streptomyces sp. NPDC092903]|uniref:DegT/DnrJ/EryC1/StrS family aminotransferase n=1 Tax=Streptomyces sp. NPDC092903 TaxID=3366017 RepID=UPI00380B669E